MLGLILNTSRIYYICTLCTVQGVPKDFKRILMDTSKCSTHYSSFVGTGGQSVALCSCLQCMTLRSGEHFKLHSRRITESNYSVEMLSSIHSGLERKASEFIYLFHNSI